MSTQKKTFIKLAEESNLVDIWRQKNTHKRKYSWTCLNPFKCSRLHLFAVNLGASARCLEIVHPISTIRHSARLFGTIAPYSA